MIRRNWWGWVLLCYVNGYCSNYFEDGQWVHVSNTTYKVYNSLQTVNYTWFWKILTHSEYNFRESTTCEDYVRMHQNTFFNLVTLVRHEGLLKYKTCSSWRTITNILIHYGLQIKQRILTSKSCKKLLEDIWTKI